MVRAVALSRAIHWLETNSLSKRKTKKKKKQPSRSNQSDHLAHVSLPATAAKQGR